MPVLRKPTPEELELLKQQGVDISQLPAELEFHDPPAEAKTSVGQAVGRTLKAHAGGIIGGGATALALTPVTGGMSLIPALVTLAAGATAGGFAGQKGQNVIQGEEITKKLEAEAEQAAIEHPIATAATDITASALASGGWPKPSNIPKAMRGLLGKKALSAADQAAFDQVGKEALSREGLDILAKNAENAEALRSVAVNATLNPAINSGINYALTGEAPTLASLGEQALGGSIFSGQSALGRKFSGHSTKEPTPEPTAKEWQDVKLQDIPELAPEKAILSPFTEKTGDKFSIDDTAVRKAYSKLNPKPDVTGLSETDAYKALTQWRNIQKSPVAEMRNTLHDAFVKKQEELAKIGIPKSTETLEKGVEKEAKDHPEVAAKNPEVLPTIVADELKTPKAEEYKKEIGVEEEKPILSNQEIAEQIKARADAESAARLEEFKKAQAEKVSQTYEDQTVPKVEKPLGENAMRILNPETMIRTEVTRPEVRPEVTEKPSKQIPAQQEPEDLPTMMARWTKELREYKPWEKKNTADENRYAPPSEDAPVRLSNEKGTIQALITKDPETKLWRSSIFVNEDGNMEPWGHQLFKSKEDAIASSKGEIKPTVHKYPDWEGGGLDNGNRYEHAVGFKELKEVPWNGENRFAPPSDFQRYTEIQAKTRELIQKGEYDSDEFHKLWRESEDIKNRNGGMPPKEETTTDKSVASEHTIKDELTNLSNDREYGELAKTLKLDEASLKSKVVEYDYYDMPHYSQINDTTRIGKNTSPEHRLHEIVHAATSKKIEYLQSAAPDHPVLKELNDCLEQTRKHFDYSEETAPTKLDLNTGYGLRNIHEFVSQAISSEQFQRNLNDIPSGKQTIWSRLVDAIRKLLGVDVKHGSMLERVLKPIDELTQMERPGSVKTKQTDTPEFKKWFGDSKVVDAEGKPLVVYHSARKGGFTEFKEESHFGTSEQAKNHIEYLLNNIKKAGDNASMYDYQGDGASTYPVYLSIKKPFHVPDKGGDPKKWHEVAENAQKAGYDGLIYENKYEGKGKSYLIFDKSQVKSAIGNRGTFDASNADIRYAPPSEQFQSRLKKQGYSFLPFLASRIDRIAIRHNNPTGKMVAEQLHKFAGEFDLGVGKIGNTLINLTKGAKPENIEKVYHYLHDIDNTGKSSITLSSAETKMADAIRESLRDVRREQIASGPKIRTENGTLREAKIKEEGYMFNILDSQVAHEWAENGPKAKAYDKAYIEHLVSKGVSVDEAEQTLADYKRALGNSRPRDVEYGAIRKAEGKGLPWELVDHNFASASLRYAERASRDLSFFKHIQSVPEMRKALDISDEGGQLMSKNELPDITPLGGSEEVTAAMRSVYGIDMPVNYKLMAAARAAGNTVMGVGTAARNILTMPAIAATYVQSRQLPLMVKAIHHMNDSRVRAFQSNAVRANFQDFDAAGYVKSDPNPVVNLLNKYSSFMRKYQGRDFSDKFEGEYYYSLGELLATDNIAQAQKGNVESRRFLRRFGDLVDGGVDRLFRGEVKPDDIQRIAKRFVDAGRGTYGAEGLPSWVIEGELAPFAALSKFSIEKSNTVWKDVIEPMKQGVYGPFLRYSLGSLGVGVLIEQLNELLSNKRGPDATVNETIANLTPENAVSKAISLAQLGSFAGIIADGAKAVTQAYQGKELRYNQPLSFPLYTLVTDTIAGNAKDAVAAIQDGQDPFEVMGMLATTIAGQSVQTMRYVDANFIHPDETKRKEKFRDVKVFQQMEGKQSGPMIQSNPFKDADAKEFKRTADIGEAAKMLPSLVQKAIKKANGDPFELKRRLTALKQNSFQTMPSLETAPLSFLRYINNLKATQGEEAASQRLVEYLQQNAVNKAKSSMVP